MTEGVMQGSVSSSQTLHNGDLKRRFQTMTMTTTKSGYATVDGGKLYYEAGGEGESLVFVHAGFVDSRMWDDQWHALIGRNRAIRFDMRGFGRSDVAAMEVSRRGDLHGLLTQLDITRTILIGCSTGGEVALDFALEHPEMVSALILVSTVPGGCEWQGEPPPYVIEMMAAIERGDVALASELQNRIWIDGPFRKPDESDPNVRRRAAEMNRHAITNGAWTVTDTNPLQPCALERLGEVGVPTLIVVGELDDPEILRAADVLQHGITGAQKVIVPSCAHLPNMERPAEFNDAVLSFLDRDL